MNGKVYNDFFREIESIFNIEKLRKDFLKYIDGNTISSVHEYNKTIKYHHIDRSREIINISDIYVIKKYHEQVFLPYQVNIIIGNFDSNFGVVLMEKFRAELLYDDTYELITVDFIHD